MLDFYKTVGGRKFCDHTIPELIRKLDKVAELDFDGLTKAMNRLAKAQEEANRLGRVWGVRDSDKEESLKKATTDSWKRDFLKEIVEALSKHGEDGLVLTGKDSETFLSATHLVDDFPIAYSIEGDWLRVWKVGISDNQAEREVEQILKVMMESDRNSIPCNDEIAKMIRDNPRVSGRLTGKGVKIDDAFGIMSLTKPVALGESK